MKLERIGEQLSALRDEAAQKWSKLTKSDLADIGQDLEGLSDALVRRYSMPAKQAREEAETFLSAFGTTFKEAASMLGDATRDLWRSGKDHVAEVVHAGGEKVGDAWDAGRRRIADLQSVAKRTIDERPMTSLALAAGIGALIAMLLRRRA